jgi:hypothetical protein
VNVVPGPTARRWTRADTAVWIGFAVLHALLFWLDLSPELRRPFGDDVMYRDVAERAGRGEPATLDLLWPPFYAWFLIPFTKIGNGWPVAVAIVQMGLQGTSAILFRALLTQATGSARVAAIGQAFFLLDPHLAAFAHYLWPETLHVFLLIVFLWLVAVRPGRVWWLTAGITLGVLGLTKSFAQPFIPIVVLVLLRDLGWRQNIAQGVAIVALAFAIMLPTMVTNARR